jgi:hypothetical protein
MRHLAFVFVMVGALLSSGSATLGAQSESAVVSREPVPSVASVALAGDGGSPTKPINPMAEQAAMAVVLGGLAAALRRWQPGKRPGTSQPRP